MKTLKNLLLVFAAWIAVASPSLAMGRAGPGVSPTANMADGPNLYAYVSQNPWTKYDPEGLFGDSYGEMSDEAQFQNDTGHPIKAAGIVLGQQALQLISLGSYSGWSHVDQSIGSALDDTQTNADAMSRAGPEQQVKILQNQNQVVKSALVPLAVTAVSMPGTSATGPVTMPESSGTSAIDEATAMNAAAKDAAEVTPTRTAEADATASTIATSTSGPYSNLPDPRNVGSGRDFTPATKKAILAQNKAKNGGVVLSDKSGTVTVPAQQSKAGITPPSNQAEIDHIVPKSKGGTNSPSNAQVLTRQENQEKGNSMPSQ